MNRLAIPLRQAPDRGGELLIALDAAGGAAGRLFLVIDRWRLVEGNLAPHVALLGVEKLPLRVGAVMPQNPLRPELKLFFRLAAKRVQPAGDFQQRILNHIRLAQLAAQPRSEVRLGGSGLQVHLRTLKQLRESGRVAGTRGSEQRGPIGAWFVGLHDVRTSARLPRTDEGGFISRENSRESPFVLPEFSTGSISR